MKKSFQPSFTEGHHKKQKSGYLMLIKQFFMLVLHKNINCSYSLEAHHFFTKNGSGWSGTYLMRLV